MKMDNSKTVAKDVTPSDKVKDITRRIPINKCGREHRLQVTLRGVVSKISDVVKGCCVRDGRTLHVNHRDRGGENHKSKKPNEQNKITKKQQKHENQTPVT